jgi:hypothetical protein
MQVKDDDADVQDAQRGSDAFARRSSARSYTNEITVIRCHRGSTKDTLINIAL